MRLVRMMLSVLRLVSIIGLIGLIGLSWAVPANAANNPTIKGRVIFQENFENTLSQWQVSQVGSGNTATPSTSQAYIGTKSLVLQYPLGGSNYVYIAKDIVSPSGDVSVKTFFYDDLDTSMGTFIEVKDAAKTNATALGVMTDKNICPACNPNRYSLRINSFQGTVDTGIARSSGWHVFEFRITGVGTTAWVDGVEIPQKNTTQLSLGQILLVSSWGLTSTAYYDELQVIDNSNKAACQSSPSDTFDNLSKWTLSQSYSQNTISYASVFGKQSAIHKMANGAGYTLMTYVLCAPTHGKVTLEFYDDLSNKGTFAAIYSSDIEQNPNSELLGVGVWSNFDDKNKYLTNGDTYKYRVNKKFSPENSTIPTGIKRKQGWHRLELFSTPVGAFARLDGVNLTWLNGKKHSQGFTYNINTDPSFTGSGIKSVGMVSTYNSTGQNYYANLKFEPLPAFTYTNTDASMRDLSFEIAKYFLNQYPNAVNRNFYDQILAHYGGSPDVWGSHNMAQEFTQMTSVAMIKAYDYKKTGNASSANQAIDLLKFALEVGRPQGRCNSTPIFIAHLTVTAELLWDKLDLDTKRAVRDTIYDEANFWRDVDFSNTSTLRHCTNPWPGPWKRLPFTRSISATNIDLMNSASRDNAWTSAFFNLAGTFSPIMLHDKNRAQDYRTLGEILGYHSFDREGDPGFGIHPAAPSEGTIPAHATLLNDFNNPTVWANPNPFYTLTTFQQIARGFVLDYPKGGSIMTTPHFHNVKPAIERAELFIDYATARSKSSAEGAPAYSPPSRSFDDYGKGNQSEDLTVQVDTLAALYKIPQEKTGLSNSVYKDRLFNVLKYEFYTLQGMPRMPWYADGSTDNVAAAATSVAPMDGWGDFTLVNLGIITPQTHHLSMVVNGVYAVDHLYAAFFLDPSFFSRHSMGDLNNDGALTTNDLPGVFQKYGTQDKAGDLNLDGNVNNLDVRSLWQF